jgi:chromosome partitioning protein
MQRSSEKATTKALKSQGAKIIPSSGVFSRASEEYRSIFDPSLNKAYKINERRREISAILAAVLMMSGETEDKKTKGEVEHV